MSHVKRLIHLDCPAAMLLLVIPLGLAGCSSATPPEPDEAAALTRPVPVEAIEVQPMTLRPALDLIGTIIAIPEKTAVVSSQLGGWVQQIKVVEGQQVHQGDKLVMLDSRSAAADVDRAKALVAEKQAVLARMQRGYLPEEVEGASQDRDKARAAMESLRGEAAALQELQARNEISKLQLETKLKTFQQAEAALASADAHLKLLVAGTRREMIDEARAVLAAAKADLEHADLALEWCTVTSPIDGVVVQHLARQGQYIDRAAPLATIMDLSEVFIQLRIPSAEFAKLRLGAPVDALVASDEGHPFRGRLARFSGDADPLTGNVVVFASIQNEVAKLRPGMGCRARLWLPEIPGALALPVVAVADHNGTAVVTVIRDGKAHEVKVELGAQTPQWVQIVKGVAAGDLVATIGGYGLPDDCPVQIVANLGEASSSVSTEPHQP
ncbi:MAG TPA: efflux RND transporter periplasmic adaptor subunit [Pirellulales bacterium]